MLRQESRFHRGRSTSRVYGRNVRRRVGLVTFFSVTVDDTTATPLPATPPNLRIRPRCVGTDWGAREAKATHLLSLFVVGKPSGGSSGFLTRVWGAMSAFGTKQTSAYALHLSAFDPKRTFVFVVKTATNVAMLARPTVDVQIRAM